MAKSRLLYGLPQALATSGPIIVCEGPTDVWRFGTNAVALIGKSLSNEQCRLLVHHFAGRPLVVALDRDAADEARHVRQKLIDARRDVGQATPVVMLALPQGGKDPADFGTAELTAAVAAALGLAPAAPGRGGG
jgi:DNA primase